MSEPRPMGTFARMGAATTAFCVVHSVAASRQAKKLAARLLGKCAEEAGYRFAYNAQALLTFGMLLRYGSRLPGRTLYRVGGTAALMLRAGQAAGLFSAYWAAREVGVLRLAGVSNLLAWVRWEAPPPGPAAQGPERLPDGTLSDSGPFAWSRHPLNFAPLPVFWLTPHLTDRRLAFNLVASAYLVLGSFHEERRLEALYGSDYQAYRSSGVSFYVPRLRIGSD